MSGSTLRARRRVMWAAISGGVVVALLTPGWMMAYRLTARARAVEAEITHLQESISAMEAERALILHDPIYVERLAREQFRSTRPGEILLELQ